jgi:hypothetical protein
MNAVSTQREQWQALIERPLDFIRPERLADCFAKPLSDEQLAAFRDMPRFQERSLRLLTTRYDLQPLTHAPDPEMEDLPVLLMSVESFNGLPRLCGAVWHGATLSREIRSDVVNQLRQLLGGDVFALALANRPLAGAADLLRQPADLLAAIDHDGAACVSAWLEAQPPELRGWLRLRLDDPGVHDQPVPTGLKIVRSVVMTLAADTGEEITP